jgi:hypothetical protein
MSTGGRRACAWTGGLLLVIGLGILVHIILSFYAETSLEIMQRVGTPSLPDGGIVVGCLLFGAGAALLVTAVIPTDKGE